MAAPRSQWGDRRMEGRRTFPTSPISGSRGILGIYDFVEQSNPQKNSMTSFTRVPTGLVDPSITFSAMPRVQAVMLRRHLCASLGRRLGNWSLQAIDRSLSSDQ
jgi:hypothetical protein